MAAANTEIASPAHISVVFVLESFPSLLGGPRRGITRKTRTTQIRERNPIMAHAILLELLSMAPLRSPAPCPSFGRGLACEAFSGRRRSTPSGAARGMKTDAIFLTKSLSGAIRRASFTSATASAVRFRFNLTFARSTRASPRSCGFDAKLIAREYKPSASWSSLDSMSAYPNSSCTWNSSGRRLAVSRAISKAFTIASCRAGPAGIPFAMFIKARLRR